MAARNDITGQEIKTRGNSKLYTENADRIFNSEEKQKKLEEKKKADAEYWARLAAETKARLESNN